MPRSAECRSCWSNAPHFKPHVNAASCAAVGNERIYAGTCETLFCYDGKGKLLRCEDGNLSERAADLG